MRVVAPIMVCLLAGVALLHGVAVRMEERWQDTALRQDAQAVSGSVVIYKTPPMSGLPLLRQVHGGHSVASAWECPIGQCQDV